MTHISAETFSIHLIDFKDGFPVIAETTRNHIF